MLVKRKAIKLARQTLVVSLPSAWVKQCNVQKGQEIDIQQQGNKLVISSEGDLTMGEKLSLSHDKLGPLLHRYLFKAYQHGVDEVTVHFSDPAIADTLKEKLPELIGYELTTVAKKHCIIRDISGQKYGEFDESLNRLFLIMNNLLADSLEALKSEDKKSMLPSLIKRDQDVNKFANFCLRLLSKNVGHTEKGQIYFSLILTLERIGDELKELFSEVLHSDLSLHQEELNHLKEIHQLFSLCYSFTMNPKIEKGLEIAQAYDQLKLGRLSLKNPHARESGASHLHHHLRTITELIVSLQEMQLRFATNIE